MTRRDKASPGFTLVELLVVMSIFVILAAIAVPTISRMGAFSRDELRSTARELHSLLKSAQIYAATYRVNTAVVYNLDNWVDPGINPENDPCLPSPVVDTVTGAPVRVILSAAMMFKMPEGKYKGMYVPVNGPEGLFRSFPGGMTLFLMHFDARQGFIPCYWSERPRFDGQGTDPGDNCADTAVSAPKIQQIGQLGMTKVEAMMYTDVRTEDLWISAELPAHVFTPSARMEGYGTQQRFVVYVGPSPEVNPDERLVRSDVPQLALFDEDSGVFVSNLVSIPIELFRSTGRVRIVS